MERETNIMKVNLDSSKRHQANLKTLFIFLAAGAFLTLCTVSASAYSYNFYGITHTNLTNEAIAEAQITVEVTDAGSNQVSFLFTNNVGDACSITDVYFDDGLDTACGAAFSPNLDIDFPYAEIPTFDGTEEDNRIIENWENGMGNWDEKVVDRGASF